MHDLRVIGPSGPPPIARVPIRVNRDNGGGHGIGARDLIGVLRRRMWLIALVTTVITVVAGYFIRNEEPLYKATATVRLDNQRRTLTTGITQPEQVDPRIADPILSQMQLLASRTLVGRVVDSLGLRLQPVYHGFSARQLKDVFVAPDAESDTIALTFKADSVEAASSTARARAPYGKPLTLGDIHFTIVDRPRAKDIVWQVASRDAAIDLLLASLSIGTRPMTDVLDVTFTASRPRIAQSVVNTLVQMYQASDAKAAGEQAHRRRLFIEEQLLRSDSQLVEAQLALSSFRSRAQLFSSRDKLTAQQTALLSLDSQRATLMANRTIYDSLLARLQRVGSDDITIELGALISSPEIAADPGIAQYYRQLVALRGQRDSLTTGRWRAAPTDPAVRRLDDLIVSTRRQIEQAVRGHVTGVDARIAALGKLRDQAIASIQSLPNQEAEEVRLVQRVEGVQKMADQLREEFQKARVAEAVQAGSVEIVDLAALPYFPSGLPRSLKAVLAVMLGMLLGCGAALVVDFMNRSFRNREELEHLLHVPSLAVIPKARARALVSGEPEPAQLMRMAQAYRLLRTNLLYSQGTQGLRTLVVTSSAPEEGKTVIAANLAVSFAREGLNILLVDCDLRRPRLHRVFDLPRGPGFAQVLANTVPLSAAITHTAVPGLSLLPCGSVPVDPTDLIKGPRMREVLATVSARYDLVILDTPPVLAIADAAILAALVDGVLFVVRAGKTDRASPQEALRQLAAVGARVVGAVLNDPAGEAALGSYASYAYEHTAS